MYWGGTFWGEGRAHEKLQEEREHSTFEEAEGDGFGCSIGPEDVKDVHQYKVDLMQTYCRAHVHILPSTD